MLTLGPYDIRPLLLLLACCPMDAYTMEQARYSNPRRPLSYSAGWDDFPRHRPLKAVTKQSDLLRRDGGFDLKPVSEFHYIDGMWVLFEVTARH